MRSRRISVSFALAVGAMLSASAIAAEQDALTPEEMTAAVINESVTIPTPGEFFAAINKIERPNWSQLEHPGQLAATTSRAKLSLNVGTRVADGFIAVEAQDGQQVKNTGRDIIDLAGALGVSESIIARGRSIGDFAENNEWSALKEELEATENEVKLQMMAQKDEALVTLVTIGAWIRGTQAASTVIATTYTPAAADLLRQASIVEYLLDRIEDLPERLQSEEIMRNLRTGITEIQEITATEEPLTVEQVERVRVATGRLVELINGAEVPPQS